MDSLGTDSRKDYKNWISNLGNLTLLDGPTNNDLGRETIVVKKKGYGESQVRLALEVSKLPNSHWDTASIEARSETLRSMGVKRGAVSFFDLEAMHLFQVGLDRI